MKNQNYELNQKQISNSSMSIDNHKCMKHFDSDMHVELLDSVKGD